jgi:hypothetical protein
MKGSPNRITNYANSISVETQIKWLTIKSRIKDILNKTCLVNSNTMSLDMLSSMLSLRGGVDQSTAACN